MPTDWPGEAQPERLPPSNAEAEEAVIGSVLLDRSLIGPLSDILTPVDFYREQNAVIWTAMLGLHNRNEPIDYLLLLDELERTNTLEASGGMVRMAGLLGAVPTPIHAIHYARIILRCAVMRRLISAGGKIATLGYQNEVADPFVAVEDAVGIVQSVLPPRPGHGPVEIGDALQEYLDFMQAVEAGNPLVSDSVPTGMADFDHILNGGMQRSDLLIVGARPSMGKTSFCLNVLCNLAAKHQGAGLMFSLEMPIRQIVGRLLALQSGIEATRIQKGDYTDVEVRRIGLAITTLAETSIYVDDESSLTISQIRDRARRLHQKTLLDFVIVDHIQLVQTSGRSREQNRTQELSDITRQLKAMARELKVPVMALSQLSRAVESRASKVPELRDLRESGSSEQDADVVAFLYRDDYYDKDSERQGITDVIVAKHRNGAIGQFSLIFNPRTMRYLEIEVVKY